MILISGASGFIGSHLVRNLLETSEDPFYIITRRKNDVGFLNNKKIRIFPADITAKIDMPDHVTSVYHCAGVIAGESEMMSVNVEGTRNIAEAAFRNNCRLIHLSSAGVIGAGSTDFIDESSECNPQNLYEKTKWEAERIVGEYAEKGLKARILRPTIVVGFGRSTGQDSFFQLIRSIAQGRYVNIGSGNGIYNIIHADEVIRAMRTLDNDGIADGEIFFLNTPVTYKELAEIVVDGTDSRKMIRNVPYCIALAATTMMSVITTISGIKMPLTYSRLKALTNRTVFSQSKIIKLTSYRPAKTIKEYINQMCRIYMQQGWIDN